MKIWEQMGKEKKEIEVVNEQCPTYFYKKY